jgi:hypothetical protein
MSPSFERGAEHSRLPGIYDVRLQIVSIELNLSEETHDHGMSLTKTPSDLVEVEGREWIVETRPSGFPGSSVVRAMVEQALTVSVRPT